MAGITWSAHGADWPNRALSHFTATRGARWHVQRGGTGPRVLLLHGAGAATHSWRDLIPRLTVAHEILAPDLPGQGFSRGTVSRYTLPGMAADLAALLEAEGFAPDVVVGHSAGAAIALRLCLDGGALPDRVVSLNGALAPFRGMAGALFPSMARLLSVNPLTGHLFARTARLPGAVRGLIASTGSGLDATGLALYGRLTADPGHVAATMAMMARWDLVPLIAELPKLNVPVTLATGLRDRAVPPTVAREVARRLPHAELIEFTDCGHLMHEEAPERFADLIADRTSESELMQK